LKDAGTIEGGGMVIASRKSDHRTQALWKSTALEVATHADF
jgi:hypothetical protein